MGSTITPADWGTPRRRRPWASTMALAILVLAVVLGVGAARASAAPDTCIDSFDCYSLAATFNNQLPITAHQQSFDVTTDLSGFTIQQDERRNCILPSGGLAWGNNSAWYRFDAGVTGSLSVSASAAFNVMLVQYQAAHGSPIDYTSNNDLPSGDCTGQGHQESFDAPLSVHTNGPTFVQVLVGCGDSSPPANTNPCPQPSSSAGPVALHFTFTCTDSDADGVCDTVDQCPAVAAATATGCPAPPQPPAVAPLTASVSRITTSGARGSVSIICAGPAGQTCTGNLAFRPRTTPETVATASYSVPVGQTGVVVLNLGANGRRMLTRVFRLPGTLSVTGTASGTRSMTFAYPIVHSGLRENDSHTCDGSRCTTTLDRLTLTDLSRPSTVTVSCRGGGCPFARHVITHHGRQLALAPLFAHHRLSPGSLMTIRASARGAVTRVFTVVVTRTRVNAGVSCLAPGAHATAACPS